VVDGVGEGEPDTGQVAVGKACPGDLFCVVIDTDSGGIVVCDEVGQVMAAAAANLDYGLSPQITEDGKVGTDPGLAGPFEVGGGCYVLRRVQASPRCRPMAVVERPDYTFARSASRVAES